MSVRLHRAQSDRRPPSRSARPRRGFSILELVIVMVFVGIVGVLSGGKISSVIAQQRVTRAASTLQTDLELAFTLASRNRAPMAISWNSTTMILSVTNRAGSLEYKRTNLKDNAFGFKSSDITVSRASTEVYPNGFANDTLSVTITATRGTNTFSKRVRMSRAGLVKVI